MAVRTALLTSRNINLDTDFSKYIETVSEPGVITGFEVTASSVATGQARVPCIRTNLETIYAFVQNFNTVSISGDGYVIISIPQNIIDNGGGNEDGTGIATIEVVNELPAKNYLLLATIESGTVTDNRNMIPKVGELKTDIDSIFASIEDLDERVEALEEAGAIDHLEEMALVGEKYALTDTLFKQLTPKLADCTVDANVWDVAANTEIHIQRQGSKTPSNKLKLKLKAVGSPTTSVVVEVRKGIQVDVSDSEAYWYGDENNIIATGSLTSSSFTTDYAEVEFTLDNNFGGTEWELLDVVVYQSTGSGATVNASNYYVLACDSTQWSEAFSYVKVNGTTRSREKLMPYCVSNWFVQAMLSKVETASFKLLETLIDYTATDQYCGSAIYINRNEISVLNKENVTLKIENLTTSNPGTGLLRIFAKDSSNTGQSIDIPLWTVAVPLNDETLLNDKAGFTVYSVQLILLAGNYYANGKIQLYSCERREKPKNAHKYYIDAVYNVWEKQAFISYWALPNWGWRIWE